MRLTCEDLPDLATTNGAGGHGRDNLPVILCKIPPRKSPVAPVDATEVQKLNDAIAAIPQTRKNVTVFDTFTLFGDSEGNPDPVNYKKDLMHPSDAGYAKMADGLTKAFDQLSIK